MKERHFMCVHPFTGRITQYLRSLSLRLLMPLCETQGLAMEETIGDVMFILQTIISCERCSNNNNTNTTSSSSNSEREPNCLKFASMIRSLIGSCSWLGAESGISDCSWLLVPSVFVDTPVLPKRKTLTLLLMAEILHHLGCMKPYK